jgi:hypothetical protein
MNPRQFSYAILLADIDFSVFNHKLTSYITSIVGHSRVGEDPASNESSHGLVDTKW